MLVAIGRPDAISGRGTTFIQATGYFSMSDVAPEGHWSRPPNIEAPCYSDRSKTVRYGISDDLTGARTRNFRHTPLFMVWAHLLGELPPINAIGKLAESEITPTLSTLADATACFQGVQRPHSKEANGDNVLTYVLKPRVTIEFASDMACLARSVSPPVAFALTVQVVLAETLHDEVKGVSGLVTRIEPVACDLDDPALPVEYRDRYRTRCW
jgi:hypothetical protein